jgi:NADH-quinone oxidoreductase subunit E
MDGLKQRIAHALRSQPQPTVTILSSLLAVEDYLGYIPKEAVDEVAAFTSSTVNDVWAVASFYPNFRFQPPCDHTVELCWGPSCHLLGAMPLIAAVLDAVGLEGEGDTPDGRLSLRYNTCLGACAQAPVISLDHQLLGRLSPEQARARVIELLSRPSSRALEIPPSPPLQRGVRGDLA